MQFRLYIFLFLLCLDKITYATQEQLPQYYSQQEINVIRCHAYDPYERLNRKIFMFNAVADYIILRPFAKFYHAALSDNTKMHMNNFYTNFTTPTTFTNSMLQLKFENAIKSFWRFVINSTIGVIGFEDVASKMGLDVKPQTFGQTLASFGIGPGPYLVIPLIGSTNLRDAPGLILFDSAANIPTYYFSSNLNLEIQITKKIHDRAKFLSTTDQIADSIDPYVMVRSMTHQQLENNVEYPDGFRCYVVSPYSNATIHRQ